MTVHKELKSYYQRLLSRHEGVPLKSDINPLELKKILSWILLIELRGPRDLVPTVVGSGIDNALGSHFTGKNMYDFYPEDLAQAHEVFYDKILSQPCGGFLVRNIAQKSGNLGTLEISVYPLKGPDGIINRLIGSLSLKGTALAKADLSNKLAFMNVSIVETKFIDIGFGVPSQE